MAGRKEWELFAGDQSVVHREEIDHVRKQNTSSMLMFVRKDGKYSLYRIKSSC